jgi:hypothetical protein
MQMQAPPQERTRLLAPVVGVSASDCAVHGGYLEERRLAATEFESQSRVLHALPPHLSALHPRPSSLFVTTSTTLPCHLMLPSMHLLTLLAQLSLLLLSAALATKGLAMPHHAVSPPPHPPSMPL